MAAHAIDVNADSFQRDVIEASGQAPVLVDFWAPWCGPCRALTPVLEKLAEQYQGKFRLVKINSDENPELSRQFGVRSIPSVKAFVDGNLVDEFLGARPESAVREFIDGLLPTPADLLRKEATELAAQGERDRALAVLAQATELEPMNDALHADTAEILLGMGRIAEAKAAAARMGPLANQDRRIGALLAQLQFADGAGTDPADARGSHRGQPRGPRGPAGAREGAGHAAASRACDGPVAGDHPPRPQVERRGRAQDPACGVRRSRRPGRAGFEVSAAARCCSELGTVTDSD